MTATPLATADAEARRMPPGDAVVAPCPLRGLTALEAAVVGEDDAGLAGVAVELRRGASGVLRARTGRDGVARFDGLEPGVYVLGLPGVDAEAWAPLDHGPLEDGSARAAAAWREPPPAPEAPREHVVAQGDSVASISQRYGYLPEALWSAPENAALRASREDRNVLLPGDRVALPPPRAKSFTAAAGLRHRIRRRGVPEVLKIRFVDAEFAARAGVAYILELEDARGEAIAPREGTTDGAGVLREAVPLDATRARVTLAPGPRGEVYTFALGHVDPIDTPSGVEARLRSLGFVAGEGGDRTALAEALRRFQGERGLAASGEADDATLRALRAAYHL